MSATSSRLNGSSLVRKFTLLLAFAVTFILIPGLPNTVEAFTSAPQTQRRRLRQQMQNLSRLSRRTDIPILPRHSTSEARLRLFLDPSLLEPITQGYSFFSEHYYFQTQAITAAICAALGDIIAQNTERQEAGPYQSNTSHDVVRTFHYFLKGLGGGIAWAYWFDFAEPLSNFFTFALVGEHAPYFLEQATRTIMAISLEQFFMSPIIFALWDIPLPALLRGSPLRQIPAQVESKLIPLLTANAKVWTFANLITYNIPVDYRVLFSSLTDIIWQAINAGITSQEIDATVGGPPLVVAATEEEIPETVAAGRRPVSSRSKSAVRALGAVPESK